MPTPSVSLSQLVQWCNSTLQVSQFKDYCPNGLQVEGKAQVSRIVTGVTASQALIDAAIAQQADAILVHHGYFWKGEPQPLTGIKGKRISSLIKHDLSLLAYHLPLDAHPTLGNNIALAELLGLTNIQPIESNTTPPLLLMGELATATSPEQLGQQLATLLGYSPQHISARNPSIRTIGLCTGAAQDYIGYAKAAGCDAFISGEISERTVHEAIELGIDYFACGHHATETGGIQRLGNAIRTQFGIQVEFINLPIPV